MSRLFIAPTEYASFVFADNPGEKLIDKFPDGIIAEFDDGGELVGIEAYSIAGIQESVSLPTTSEGSEWRSENPDNIAY